MMFIHFGVWYFNVEQAITKTVIEIGEIIIPSLLKKVNANEAKRMAIEESHNHIFFFEFLLS